MNQGYTVPLSRPKGGSQSRSKVAARLVLRLTLLTFVTAFFSAKCSIVMRDIASDLIGRPVHDRKVAITVLWLYVPN